MSRILTSTSLQPHDQMLSERIAAETSGYHLHGELKTNAADSKTLAMANNAVWYTLTFGAVGEETGTGYLVGSAANGTITIGAKGGGLYLIVASITISTDTNAVISMGIDVDGTLIPRSTRKITLTTTAGNQNLSHNVFGVLVPTNVVSILCNSSANSTTITAVHAGLNMVWIAGV